MKKLLFTLAITVATFSLTAQKDVSVTLNAPASGTTFEVNTPIGTDLTITNVGPDTLFVGDTVVYGYALGGGILAAYIAERPTDTVLPGESWTITENIEFSALSGASAVDFCAIAAFADTNVTDVNLANNQSCISVTTVDGTANIEGLVWENITVSAFPNPATDVVTFEVNGTDATNVTIVGLDGKVVASQEITGTTTEVNVADLKAGVYIYTIYAEKGAILSKKLMVK